MIRGVVFGGHGLIIEGLYWKWPYKRGNTVIRSEINVHFIYKSNKGKQYTTRFVIFQILI